MKSGTTLRSRRSTELFYKLQDGINQLLTSKKWEEFLKFQRQFHSYSFNNVVLIFNQFPTATRVASYTTWKKLKRTVREKEKAIWILAPIITKIEDDNESSEIQIRGYRYVPVFDITQTEGKEPPVICSVLEGNDFKGKYRTLIEVASEFNFKVKECEINDSSNGDCSFDTRTIRIKCENSTVQKIKTLVHELAHGILHEFETDRALAELEAESVAFIVCGMLEIDTADYSFGYLTNWGTMTDNVIDTIKRSGENIQKCSDTIYQKLLELDK
jgi:hypothetical protein